MNKKTNNYNTIIVVAIIIVSIIVILSEFKKGLQSKYYLIIDSNNKEYIEKLVIENYKLTGKLDKIAYKQGLGDWNLFLYYEDGIESKITFGDSNKIAQPLKEYIVKNGYNEEKLHMSIIKIAFVIIIVAIVYEGIYLILKSKSKNNKNRIE